MIRARHCIVALGLALYTAACIVLGIGYVALCVVLMRIAAGMQWVGRDT